jgi:VanZ family protein
MRDSMHVLVYIILTFLLFRGFRGNIKRLSLKNFVYPGLIAICFSFADELSQIFIPDRGASIGDCLIDGLAVLFVLLLLFRKYRASIVKEHAGLQWAERPIWNTDSIKKYAYAWLPVVAYIGVLFVAANILLTNENTLRMINYATGWMAPDTSHATVCMVVGKTRDWSHILIYAVFMYLIFRAFKKTCKKTMVCYVVMAGICALSFGALDEVAQMLVAGRSASITDWGIDVMGVVVGIGIILAKNKNNATLETHPHKVD